MKIRYRLANLRRPFARPFAQLSSQAAPPSLEALPWHPSSPPQGVAGSRRSASGGRRCSRKFDHKRDAQRWARIEEAASDRLGRAPAKADATLNDLIEEFVAHQLEHGRMSRSREGAIRHIAELLGRRPLRDLTVAAFRDFARQRRAEGAGPATVGQDLSYIHSILVVGGPLLDVPVEAPLAAYVSARRIFGAANAVGRSRERDRRPTDAELVTLRDFWATRRRVTPMWDLTRFAVATGMRLSEINRLTWADLDAGRRMIRIRDRKHPRAKAGNDQLVPLLIGPALIGGETVDPLAIIEAQPRVDAPIFPYLSATVSTGFTRAVAACGIDDLRFHDLRHDAVSRLFEAGYAIEQVALVSGHKDWSMLRRYVQLRPESLHR